MNEKLNNKNLDAMINVVSGKLNVPPDVLKKQLQEGKFDKALNNMNKSDYQKFNQLMNNPQMAQKLLSAPQLQELYKKLTS
ncbi:MAG: hypothetical protein LIO71_08500 [Ruminococcus sp.]|nr:hypothetical protein [Ruminococcus sp.]MCD7800336.1 hypothetical protein [Ruminococcus sp.]